jgi:hypothetical protein
MPNDKPGPGRPLLGDEKLERRTVMLRPTQIAKLEKVQEEYDLDSFSAALRKALDAVAIR